MLLVMILCTSNGAQSNEVSGATGEVFACTGTPLSAELVMCHEPSLGCRRCARNMHRRACTPHSQPQQRAH